MSAEDNPLRGRWRIIRMHLWYAAHINLVGPVFIRFDADGGGETVFGAVQATLDCHWGSRSMHFTWEGGDEGDHVSGDGDAELENDGTISGEIRFNNGDETTFTARRA